MTYTVKGKGWRATWESRTAKDLRPVKPSRKNIAQIHRVGRRLDQEW